MTNEFPTVLFRCSRCQFADKAPLLWILLRQYSDLLIIQFLLNLLSLTFPGVSMARFASKFCRMPVAPSVKSLSYRPTQCHRINMFPHDEDPSNLCNCSNTRCASLRMLVLKTCINTYILQFEVGFLSCYCTLYDFHFVFTNGSDSSECSLVHESWIASRFPSWLSQRINRSLS